MPRLKPERVFLQCRRLAGSHGVDAVNTCGLFACARWAHCPRGHPIPAGRKRPRGSGHCRWRRPPLPTHPSRGARPCPRVSSRRAWPRRTRASGAGLGCRRAASRWDLATSSTFSGIRVAAYAGWAISMILARSAPVTFFMYLSACPIICSSTPDDMRASPSGSTCLSIAIILQESFSRMC